MLELYLKGGLLMHPILACSVLMLTILIERTAYFWRIGSGTILEKFPLIERCLLEGNTSEAKKIAGALSGPIAHILQIGLVHPEEKAEIIEENMAIAGDEIARQAAKGLSLLALIPSISTLLGLLGTVIGLSLAFQKVALLENLVSPALLASGIWVALITTVAGLLVAIPSLIAHHYIQNKVSRLTFEIEHFGSRLLLLLKKHQSHTESGDEKSPLNPHYENPAFRMTTQQGNP